MDEQENIRAYKDRLRIFLILYFFAEDYSEASKPTYKKIFKSQGRIKKIEFLLRNQDYLP